MVEINSSELNTDVDLTCCYCGKDHSTRSIGGALISIEGKDFVYEREGNEEYCICLKCQKECN